MLEDNLVRENGGKHVSFKFILIKKVFKETEVPIYIISTSDYDQILYESVDKTNAMKDALETFEMTVNGEWFLKSKILVVFNKEDILKKKIEEKDTLSEIFPEYKGGKNFEKAQKFIEELFLSKVKGEKDRIFIVHGYIHSDITLKECFSKFNEIYSKIKK